ncbi:MAG: methyltransferase domain-containing protein [Proteobacteria bacterium]|nr:methyltransferase domain-containing protein [Pseudomonadota bacterium]
MRHVLEHLPDSILAMNKIGDLLKDNGLALLEFPNTRSMSYSVKRVLKNRGRRNKNILRIGTQATAMSFVVNRLNTC